MTCQEFSRLTTEYLARALPEAQRAAYAAHAQSCAVCGAELAREEELDGLLRGVVTADTVAADRVNAAVRQRIGAEARVQRTRALQAMAAALVIGVAGWGAYAALHVPAVYAQAAGDHRREVVDGQRRVWVSDLREIQTLGSRLGLAAVPVETLAPAGHTFHHGRLCRLDGKLFLHLTYRSSESEISLFVQKPDTAPAALIGRDTVNGHSCWQRGDVAAVQTAEMQVLVTGTAEPAVIARYAAGRL